MALSAGSRLGPYEILSPLGSGGMGEVYRARDARLGRDVAIKVLPESVASDPERLKRFEQEAKTAGALNHPNLLAVYDVGTHNGAPYIVSELLEGETVRERLRSGELSPRKALEMAIAIAQGLSAVHAKGIVHRDLKPGNVFLTKDGHVKILDFGLAKLAKRDEVLPEGETASQMTAAGSALGTAGYMSPEQIRGQAADHRSDIFSLGVVLHEMVSGRRPFRGETSAEVMTAILREDPPELSESGAKPPPGLERIVRRCLEKRPEDRFHSAHDLALALEAISTSSGPNVSSAGVSTDAETARTGVAGLGIRQGAEQKSGRRTTAWAAAGVVVLLIVGWAIKAFRPLGVNPAPPPTPTVIAVLPFSVSGSGDIGYLREGIVHLLSTNLDGAGETRSIDPQMVLKAVEGQLEHEHGLDPERGRAVAARFGAGRYVLGSVVGTATRARITAALYETSGGGAAVAQSSVEGAAEQVLDLVDRLTAQLLANADSSAAARLPSLAAMTTKSFPALKAYLEGESHYRAARPQEAIRAFRAAIAADDSFALAHYRLGQAAGWIPDYETLFPALERAELLSDRLSERDRLLVKGARAWWSGDFNEADRLYGAAAGRFPDELEAWYWLGEVLIHYNPFRGRSPTEAREPLDRALALDPRFNPALVHRAEVAARENNRQELLAYAKRFLELDPKSTEAFVVRALQAHAEGDATRWQQFKRELSASGETTLVGVAVSVAAFTQSPEHAEEIAALLSRTAQTDLVKALGFVLEAHALLSQGRRLAAREKLGAAERHDAAQALAHRALLLSLPFLETERAATEAALASVESLRDADPSGTAGSTPMLNPHQGLRQPIKLYLLGLLNHRLGRTEAGLRQAEILQELELPRVAGSAGVDFAQSLRAQVAWRLGRPQEALAALEAAPVRVVYPLMFNSAFFSHAIDRFLRAEVMSQLGRHEEALGWYESTHQQGVYDLIYLAPSHLRRAEIYEKRGQTNRAVEHYRRFVDLWKDCDPELRPMLERAKGRLASLGAAASGRPTPQ